MTSGDAGVTWVGRACPSSTWVSVCFGNGVFVSVANSGVGTRAMRSTNGGVNWALATTSADNLWTSVAFGAGLFVAVSSDGTNRVMTSPTGQVWTSRSVPLETWECVTFGAGGFVAVSSSGSSRVMTSLNGLSWTQRPTPGTNVWSSVAYGNGLYVAVSATGVMTSVDGIQWTAGASAVNNAWNGVVYGEGLFVAVSSTGTLNRAMYVGGPVPADLLVSNTATVLGNVSVGGSLAVGNVLSVVGQSREIQLRNYSVQFLSNGVVASSMTTVGTANVANGGGELVMTGSDYTYVGSSFNNGVNASTGIVLMQAYPMYPVIPDGEQSIRQYALSQRFWSGRVPRNSVTPETLQFWGSGSFPLYGTYSVQYMTKSGTFHNAIAMCMRGTVGSPGNTNALTWQVLTSSTSGTAGLSITFGAVSSFVPQISFTNTTNVNGWFHVSAVVFEDSVVDDQAAS